jgi:hypothetical protein
LYINDKKTELGVIKVEEKIVSDTVNLVKNGDFSYPPIDSEYYRFHRWSELSNDFKSSFVWYSTNNETLITNLSVYYYIYPPIFELFSNARQVMSIGNMPSVNPVNISQLINITQIGFYELSFEYSRGPFSSSEVNVTINDTLFESIPRRNNIDTETKFVFKKILYVDKLGDLKLSFDTYSRTEPFEFFLFTDVRFSLIRYDSVYRTYLTKVIPTNFSNQVITQTHNKITKANLKETSQIVNTKKWIGGTKNTDSSGYIKKKTSNAITKSAI